MNFFGEVVCQQCKITTRFISNDFSESESTMLYLIGDEVSSEWTDQTDHIKVESQCDYCGKENDIYVILQQQVVADFLNEEQFLSYQKGQFPLNAKKKEEMMEKEFNQKSDVFDFHTKMDYALHPIFEESTIEVNGDVWNIKEVWKKEFVERDEELRMQTHTKEGYVYLLEKNGAQKWLVVNEEEGRNATFTVKKPTISEGEKWFEVHTDLVKTEEVYRMKMGEELHFYAHQQLSGVRGQVYYGEEELMWDGLEDSLDQLFESVEEFLNNYVL